MTEIRDIITRAPRALLSDAIGLAAICLMLVTALSLPGLM